MAGPPDTLRSAVHYWAVIASYAALTDSRRNGSRWACGIVDREAGAEHAVDIRCGNLPLLPLARRLRMVRNVVLRN